MPVQLWYAISFEAKQKYLPRFQIFNRKNDLMNRNQFEQYKVFPKQKKTL